MAVYFYYGEDIKNFQLDNSLHSDKDVYRQEEYEKFFKKMGTDILVHLLLEGKYIILTADVMNGEKEHKP